MKTSKKILITSVSVILALVLCGLLILRNNLTQILSEQKPINYKEVPVQHFKALEFSSGWDVKILQGITYKVEIAADSSKSLHTVNQVNGKISFSTENKNQLKARITVPSLKRISAKGKTKIYLRDIETDTLYLQLENGVQLSGKDNNIEFISVDTKGNSHFEFTDGMDF